ncbi:MAG: hypothetical protein KTR13_08155 [Saprospiraceae bacterium]|nr:hypothetical protein [Saprospiraceae bacterium]
MLFLFMVSACGSSQRLIKCPTGKPNVSAKKFSTKKKKSKRSAYSYGGSSASTSPRSTTPQVAKVPNNTTTEPTEETEERVPEIAELPEEREEAVPEEEVPIVAERQINESPEEPVYEIIVEESPVERAETTLPSTTPDNPSPTINNKPPTRSVTISGLEPGDATPLDVELEPGQILFRGEVYEPEEKIRFNQFIVFMPNHDIVINPEEANRKLDDLVQLLTKYPDRELTIIGNAGWDNFDDLPGYNFDYQTGPFGERIKIHYGKGPLVYGQRIYVSDDDNLPRLREEGVRPVQSVILGQLMRERGIMVRQLLMERGISKDRMSIRLGEFFKSDDRHVTFVIR